MVTSGGPPSSAGWLGGVLPCIALASRQLGALRRLGTPCMPCMPGWTVGMILCCPILSLPGSSLPLPWLPPRRSRRSAAGRPGGMPVSANAQVVRASALPLRAAP